MFYPLTMHNKNGMETIAHGDVEHERFLSLGWLDGARPGQVIDPDAAEQAVSEPKPSGGKKWLPGKRS